MCSSFFKSVRLHASLFFFCEVYASVYLRLDNTLIICDMCEFVLPSLRCAVTGDFCRQFAQLDYLRCGSRDLGFTIYDYSQFVSYVTGSRYPRPSPPEFDYGRDVYLECPF